MPPALANHLLQSTVFAVAAGLLTLLLRNNHARTRYWIWLTASLKFLIPFSIFVEIGHHLSWSTAPVIAQQPSLAIAIDTITQPFEAPPVPIHIAAPTQPILPAIWICGSSLLLIFWLIRWCRAAALLRTSSAQLEPGVFGIIRPVLYLPAGIADNLDEAQLKAIIAHELCHIRNRDNLTAALHSLVEAIFWFHPLTWWIGARLVEERERACDEEVVMRGSDPEVYAESILKICKLYLESPLVCVSGITGSDLKKRIEAIMTNRAMLRVNLAKKVALAAAAIVALAAPLLIGILHAPGARGQSVTPKFEVASIRPGCGDGAALPPGEPGGKQAKSGRGAALSSAGTFNECGSLENFIRTAYIWYADAHFHGRWIGPPIEGGPAWIHSDQYRINAKASGTPGREVISGPMLQALLEDRFGLRIHRETSEVPVYALTVAKTGAKLPPFKEGSCVHFPQLQAGETPPTLKPGQMPCMNVIGLRSGPNMGLKAEGENLEEFSKLLSLALDRPVIDKTGITGTFNIHLEFAVDESTPKFLPGADAQMQPAQPSNDPAGPSIFTAMQQELGLKLDAAKGPREFIVIDQVERPSGN
jgi:bla regulator protein BlaR1